MSITLESLVGLRMLDARGEFVGSKEHGRRRGRQRRDWQERVVVLRLDGVLYWFQEDPNDGYRSALSHVRIARFGDVPPGALAEFPARFVNCWLRTKPDEVLVGTDEATGTVLFEIGTADVATYYPGFISHWMPPPTKE